ncbi:LCP family protein [Paenibacillus sp. HB172176]|uniref:LCP family protein n=1 Tax=Paenibacillus sp. HB172176 TaxID=2493690 RepID=UPI0014395F82|nr:LCP family protein [Paenibacillus sp. HB172176]
MTSDKSSLPPRASSRRISGPDKPKKPVKKKKKKRNILIPLFATLFGLLLILAVFLAHLALKANDAINTIGINESNDLGETVITPVPKDESVKEKPVAFLIMGLDSRHNGGGLNTDVMMVAAFDPDTKKATFVTIPRDTYVKAGGYSGGKINAAYAEFYMHAKNTDKMEKTAAELAGKKGARETLGDYFGIDIKYAAMINFSGFEEVIDALGGVKVNVDMRMRYSDSADGTNIDLQKGEQVLDGKNALDFVRYRKSNDGTNMSSDFERNERQSQVLKAILDKMMTLGGLTKLDDVIKAVGDNVSMDMQSSEIRNMLAKYKSLRSDDITFMALDGTWKSPYVYADDDSLQAARDALQAIMAE